MRRRRRDSLPRNRRFRVTLRILQYMLKKVEMGGCCCHTAAKTVEEPLLETQPDPLFVFVSPMVQNNRTFERRLMRHTSGDLPEPYI